MSDYGATLGIDISPRMLPKRQLETFRATGMNAVRIAIP